MEEQDAMGFLKVQCAIEGATDADLRRIWEDAAAAVETSAVSDLSAEVVDIPGEVQDHLDAVSKQPMFAEVVQQREWSFKQVEIDKLVCFQKYVDTDYTDDLANREDLGNLAALIEFCLPLKPAKRQIVKTVDPYQNAYTIFAPNMDLRILGMAESEDQVTKRRLFGFAVGFGVRFIQVVEFADRYFLRNGYHHVYVLRRKGIKHVPCLLIQGQDFGETGAAKPGFLPQRLLLSDRPPTFADFFSDKAAPQLTMRSVTKIVRVKADEFALPLTTPMPPSAETAASQVHAATPLAKVESSEYEDFTVEKEGWNVYKLGDGTIVKLRQLLMRIGKGVGLEASETGLQIEFSNLLMATYPPRNLHGQPSTEEYTVEELMGFVVESDVKYEIMQETTNEYHTASNVRLKLRLTSVKIDRTSKFDVRGEPRYLANAQVDVQLDPPGLAD
jgi:hypothetical protein